MIAVRGTDFCKPEPGLKAWAKHIRSSQDIDLNRTAGYAIKARFIDIDAMVSLQEHEFLFIGCEHSTLDRPKYEFILVHNINEELRRALTVQASAIRTVVRNELFGGNRLGLIPQHRRQQAGSEAYSCAVYCARYFRTLQQARDLSPSEFANLAIRESQIFRRILPPATWQGRQDDDDAPPAAESVLQRDIRQREDKRASREQAAASPLFPMARARRKIDVIPQPEPEPSKKVITRAKPKPTVARKPRKPPPGY